jgi:hypothetical protein
VSLRLVRIVFLTGAVALIGSLVLTFFTNTITLRNAPLGSGRVGVGIGFGRVFVWRSVPISQQSAPNRESELSVPFLVRVTWGIDDGCPTIAQGPVPMFQTWNVSINTAGLIFALLVGLVWTWRRTMKRGDSPVCECGYDLKGNQSGKCPECGTVISVASRAGSAVSPR